MILAVVAIVRPQNSAWKKNKKIFLGFGLENLLKILFFCPIKIYRLPHIILFFFFFVFTG